MPSCVEVNAWISRQTQTHRGHMTAYREVDMYMHQLACKHTPTHTQPCTLHSVMVNPLIIESSFFGWLFNGLCLLFIFKSRNHCSHFHIKIPPLRNMLLCGRLVAFCSFLSVPIRTNVNPYTNTLQCLLPGPSPGAHWGQPHKSLDPKELLLRKICQCFSLQKHFICKLMYKRLSHLWREQQPEKGQQRVWGLNSKVKNLVKNQICSTFSSLSMFNFLLICHL